MNQKLENICQNFLFTFIQKMTDIYLYNCMLYDRHVLSLTVNNLIHLPLVSKDMFTFTLIRSLYHEPVVGVRILKLVNSYKISQRNRSF
jgi:hypothetical protein